MTPLNDFAPPVEGFVAAKGRYASCVFAFMSRESAAQSPQLTFSGGADAVLLAVPSAALGLVAGIEFPSASAPPGPALSSKARPRGRCGFFVSPAPALSTTQAAMFAEKRRANMVLSVEQHCASRAFTDNVLCYWALGLDSAEIAEVLCYPEALVYNLLARLRVAGRSRVQ